MYRFEEFEFINNKKITHYSICIEEHWAATFLNSSYPPTHHTSDLVWPFAHFVGGQDRRVMAYYQQPLESFQSFDYQSTACGARWVWSSMHE